MAVVFRNVWILTCFETYIKCVYFGGRTGAAQFSKYIPQCTTVVVVVKFKFKSMLSRQPRIAIVTEDIENVNHFELEGWNILLIFRKFNFKAVFLNLSKLSYVYKTFRANNM